MENKNASMVYDACVNTYNYNFGKIMDGMLSVPEEMKAKFLADLDAKIRAGDLTSDKSVMAYLDSYPELKASIAPEAVSELPKVVKTVAIQNAYIQRIKKARDYQAALEKQKALDNKIVRAEPLTEEEERLVKLSMFENLSKDELKQKIDAIKQKEAENKTKPEDERIPLTEDERDLKEFNEIQSQEATAKRWAEETAILRQEGAHEKAPDEKDYWTNLEGSDQEVEQDKENYVLNYHREKEDINQPTDENDKPAEKEQDKSALDKPTFAAKKEPELTDPETIDWGKFREEVIWKNLNNLGKSGNIADMGFAMFTTLFIDMAADAIDNLVKQMKEINKANEKKKKDLRDTTIDNNLKDNGLTRETFARTLAVEVKNWIMDTSHVQGLDLSNPSKLTPAQKFAIKKAEFARRLPKTENGDIDFEKMSKSQKAQYDRYLVMYANSSKWLQKSDQILGVRVTKKELLSFIIDARQAKPKGGLEHLYEDVRVDKKAPKRETPVKVDRIAEDIVHFVDNLESGRALTAKEQEMLGATLRNRGFSKEEAKKIQNTFAQQGKGATDKDGNLVKPSDELRQAVLDVIVKGSLDDYEVTGALSKTQITPREQAMIALQVDRCIKQRKGLKEKQRQLNAFDHQLAEMRNRASNANDQHIQMQRGKDRS